MGRTKGEGARSKSRPSSSSLAASLSQGAGAVSAGFGGYIGSTRVDSAGPSEDAFYQNIDGETAANLRRLSKKDPITKLKALSALTTYFQEHSAAEVSPLLSCWVFEYKKLVQDNSRQVREAAQKAMCSLVSTVGRSLAPHLRSVMGAWWMAHFDPFYEVSDAAKQAFLVAFPGQKKRLEALIYCANDILTNIDENLKLTPQTISEKSTPLEESIEKLELVVSSSLFSLSAILNILFTGSPSDSTEKIASAAVQLFKDHKMFQGLMKSGPRVRTAVYEILRAYAQYVPQVFSSENLDPAIKLILGAFLEKDTGCHQAMWDMILVFSQRFGQGWAAKKIVHQRFWAFLRHGCYGSQKISYPCLMPLFSLIPASAIAPARDFLLQFFGNLWKGLEEGPWTREDGVLLLSVSIPIISSKPQEKGLSSPPPESKPRVRMPSPLPSVKSQPASAPVVVEAPSRSLEECAASWRILPESLVSLGKDALQRRNAASMAAAVALQEASAYEEVLRSLSIFAELRALAKPEAPQPTVEKFLVFHRSLEQASAAVDALLMSDKPPAGSGKVNFSSALSEEKAKCAKSWVDSALACDLSAFTLHRKGQKVSSKEMVNPVVVVEGMDHPASTLAVKTNRVVSSSATPLKPQYTAAASPRRAALSSVTPTTNEKKDSRAASPLRSTNGFIRRNLNSSIKASINNSKPPVKDPEVEPKWIQGQGVKETGELAKLVRVEAQSWFFKFMEEALDKGFRSEIRDEINNNQLAAILSQLKRVNDWLDQVASEKEDVPDLQLVETLARLKRKIYEFLLKHVESAACALGTNKRASHSVV